MKRHPSLQPLSREHHRALVCWRELDQRLRAANDDRFTLENLGLWDYWPQRFLGHMYDEEQLLLQFLSDPLRCQLLEQHEVLRWLFSTAESASHAGSALAIDRLLHLADTLRTHIRWEERIVFPYLETHLLEEQLLWIGIALRQRDAETTLNCSVDSARSHRKGQL